MKVDIGPRKKNIASEMKPGALKFLESWYVCQLFSTKQHFKLLSSKGSNKNYENWEIEWIIANEI